MRHNPMQSHQQQGAMLIMVIMITVVMGVLGAAMVSMLGVSNTMVAKEVIAIRALMSANSGANKAMECVVANNSCTGGCDGGDGAEGDLYSWAADARWPPAGADTTDYGLAGCTATIQCTAVAGGYFDIVSTGVCGETHPATRVVSVRIN